jgi:hypothetical protein
MVAPKTKETGRFRNGAPTWTRLRIITTVELECATGRPICTAKLPERAAEPFWRPLECDKFVQTCRVSPRVAPTVSSDWNWPAVGRFTEPDSFMPVGILPFEPGGTLFVFEIGTPLAELRLYVV